MDTNDGGGTFVAPDTASNIYNGKTYVATIQAGYSGKGGRAYLTIT